MNAVQAVAAVELEDIQGLLRFGYKHHTETAFLLLRVREPKAAGAWLAQAPVAHALPADPPPATVLQLALTSSGLRALGLPAGIVESFSAEFVTGLGSDASQARRLGDVDANDPARWAWGTGERVPHVLALLYALPGRLAEWQAQITAGCAAGFEVMACLAGSDMGGREPFGFADGFSQPELDWERQRLPRDETRGDYDNLSCLGEFLLGYPNEYGGYTDRPLLAPAGDAQRLLPRAEDAPGQADLGRNGSYLVMRQLEQDVAGFWRWLDTQAGGDTARRDALAAAMVGRTLEGQPLAETHGGDLNAFSFDADPDGLRCPVGAHIRRSNPRSVDLPPGDNGGLSRLLRTFGFDAPARQHDRVASTRFHRLLRRGRAYGTAPADKTGLFFIALNASLSRQFEFVQGAWIASSHFNGLSGESDPLLGTRQHDNAGRPTDCFSMPQADGPDRRISGLPQFVTVRGGAYFFMPGIRALRYLATAAASGQGTARPPPSPGALPMNSNASRPVPPANTGSWLKNWFSDTSMRMLQLERRIDPLFRPAFDAWLRDPLSAFVSDLINRQRPRDDLKLAEERLLPDEEAWTESVIESFRAQMSGLWKPGGYERGGNTKTQGILRAEFIVHDGLPEHLRHGVFAEPRTWPAWVRFSGPGPYVTPDIDDVGFMSISIKLMGVPGPKLMDEEKYTQDMFGVSTPTFVTQDIRSNAHLQKASLLNASIYHFLNFNDPHLLDVIMQGLWIKAQSSPFEAPYFSCVPYLLGEGQAMQYSVWPKSGKRTPIPRLPLRPPDDYLRIAMVQALAEADVHLDYRIQVQTDPWRMPIENNGVLWPEKLSPRISAATLRIPQQRFDSAEQIAFARRLSYNPWHCIAEHRPLGNQSRARRRMYWELSKLRHEMNAVPRYEPDGTETFD